MLLYRLDTNNEGNYEGMPTHSRRSCKLKDTTDLSTSRATKAENEGSSICEMLSNLSSIFCICRASGKLSGVDRYGGNGWALVIAADK